MGFRDLDDDALFLLRWVFCFGEEGLHPVFCDDVWPFSDRDVSAERAEVARATLLGEGWVEEREDEEGVARLHASAAAQGAEAEIFRELAEGPLPELTLFQLCVVMEALWNGGYLVNRSKIAEGWEHLSDRPAQEIDDLVAGKLLVEHLDETWLEGIAPEAWAHRSWLLERFSLAQGQLREALHAWFLKDLKLEPDDPIAEAYAEIDRADFVPPEERNVAYRAMPVQILDGMTTSQPNVVGHILKSVDVKPGDRVLVCGAKSGDLAVIAAKLAGHEGRVVVLDDREDVRNYAQERIDRFNDLRGRIELRRVDDVTVGDEDRGPWDVVIVNGALAKIPRDLLTQSTDGGRLLFFMHDPHCESQRCLVVRKNEDVLMPQALGNFNFTPLAGRWGWDDPEDLQEAYRRAREARARRGPAQRIDHELPYPLARAYGVARNAGDAGERHTRALKAYEALLKYLTIPVLAARSARGVGDGNFKRHLHTLANRPSLGHWLAAARDLTKPGVEVELLGGVRETLWGALVHPAARRTLEGLHDQLPRLEAPRGEGCLLDLLTAVLAYRNRSGEGHGGARNADLLLEGLGQVLVTSEWLVAHRLVHFAQLTLGRGGARLRALDFRGASMPTLVPEAEAAGWYARDRGAVEQAMGAMVLLQGEEQLCLDPWAVWGRGQMGSHEDLFLFNGRHKSGDPEYLTTYDPNTYPALDERRAFEELVAAFPVQKRNIDLEAARLTFEAMLDAFLGDGVLDSKEMTSLCVTLVNLGVFEDEGAAAEYVREVARERNPGVLFED